MDIPLKILLFIRYKINLNFTPANLPVSKFQSCIIFTFGFLSTSYSTFYVNLKCVCNYLNISVIDSNAIDSPNRILFENKQCKTRTFSDKKWQRKKNWIHRSEWTLFLNTSFYILSHKRPFYFSRQLISSNFIRKRNSEIVE